MVLNEVVITGVNGFIGSALAHKLLSKGIVVYGVDIESDKFKQYNEFDSFVPVYADFTKYSDIGKFISTKNIDVFFHLAWAGGFTSAIKDHKLQMQNAGYAGDAVLAAVDIGAKRFVYAGTYNQYEIVNFLISDYFEPRYTCIYSAAKTAASLLCRTIAFNNNIEYSAGLIPMPYGKNNFSKQLMNIVFQKLMNGEAPSLVEGNNLYDVVYIDDIVDGLIAISERGKNMKEYYIGHRDLKTFRELFTEIRDIISPDTELKFGEYKDNQQIDYSKIDLDALYKDTGFECKADFKDTILDTAKWVKENIK